MSDRASLTIQDEAPLLLTLESRKAPDRGGSYWPSIVSRHREPSSEGFTVAFLFLSSSCISKPPHPVWENLQAPKLSRHRFTQ